MKSVTQLLLIKQLKDRLDEAEWKQGDQGIQGETGMVGPQGVEGRAGRDGQDGAKGKDGAKGQDGKDGADGEDGISIIDANIAADGDLVFSLSDGSELSVEMPTLGKGEGDTYIATTGVSRNVSVFDVEPRNIANYSYLTTGNAWQEAGCITIPLGNTEDFYIRVYAQEVGNPENTFFGVYAGLAQNITGTHAIIQNLETITRKTTNNRVSFRVSETPTEICGEVRPGLGETWEFRIDYTRQILWQS